MNLNCHQTTPWNQSLHCSWGPVSQVCWFVTCFASKCGFGTARGTYPGKWRTKLHLPPEYPLKKTYSISSAPCPIHTLQWYLKLPGSLLISTWNNSLVLNFSDYTKAWILLFFWCSFSWGHLRPHLVGRVKVFLALHSLPSPIYLIWCNWDIRHRLHKYVRLMSGG